MGLSQEMASTQPAKRALPPKPKKPQGPTTHMLPPHMPHHTCPTTHMLELKPLPKKSVVASMWEQAENPFIDYSPNTPPMDFFCMPDMLEEDLADSLCQEPDSSEVDTLPLEPEMAPGGLDDIWGDLVPQACVAPAEAEGRDVVIQEFLVDVEENNEMLLNPESDDLLKDSLLQSGIDFDFDFDSIWDSDVTLAPGTLLEPITSTKLFIETRLQEIKMESTINLEELMGLSSSPDEDAEAATDPNDPDWPLPSSSTRQKTPPVYARKTVLHTVQKTTMRKKPGRPERQMPFVITEVPSRRDGVNVAPEVIQGLKYRRMRDLNNRASKECRARRKNKQELLECELEQERERNVTLRRLLKELEEEIAPYQKMNSQY